MPLIFLDTEFTDFNDPDLISIGAVAEDGREFYAESTEYRQEACSDFVRQVVIPLLGEPKNRVVGNYFEIAKQLNEWLKFYTDEIVIAIDYLGDWQLLVKLLSLLPEEELVQNVKGLNIYGDLDTMALEYYWAEVDAFGHKEHHALYDARGNKYAYKPLVRERNG
jgi:3' exoribonuclease, RNase T-like